MGVDILALLRRTEPTAAHPVTVYRGEGPSRYGEVALQREAEAVAHAQPGRRNDTLNRAIFNLAQLVAAQHLDAERVRATLTNAAGLCGLGEAETQATLRSGYRAGMKQPRAVPPWEAEAVKLHAVPALDDADEEAPEPEPDDDRRAVIEAWVRENLPALDWHELWADDSEDEWILEPLVPARRLVALYSPPKVGKSLLMLELAAAVSAGRQVLGVCPERRWRVLYVDFENDPRGDVRPRLQAMGYGPADLDRLHYLSFPVLSALDTEAGAAQLLAAVEAYGAELVVIDTLSRAVAGEENDNDTWLSFYRNTGLRLKQAEVACVRLDHAGKDVERGQRGGSAKAGDVDAIWRMSHVADDTYSLACEANRLPIAEKYLTFERRPLPHLHSAVQAEGRLAAWNAKIDSLVALMDDAGLPADAGRPKLMELVKGTGLTASTAAAREAVKRRKLAAGLSVLHEGDMPDSPVRGARGQLLSAEDSGQPWTGGAE
jgi:hypothetical protein